jgi:hypothetical protein
MATPDRARKNGLKAAKTVQGVLKTVGWEPEETDEEAVLRIDFSTDNTPVSDALAKVRVDIERFIFLINFRDQAAPKTRAQVAEFITRANYDMVIGNFELDYETGSVRFKSSVDFTEAMLSEELVRNAIQSAMDVVEHYDALVEVMRGAKRAKEAVEEAESRLG